MKKLVLIFLLFTFALRSQSVDSLLSVLKTCKEDTNKLTILFTLVESIDDDKIWSKYNEQAHALSQNLANNENETISTKGKKGIAEANQNMGVLCEQHGKVLEAIEHYKLCLKLYLEVGDKSGIAEAYNGLGNIYSKEGNIPTALEVYEQSLKMREELGDKKGTAYTLNNIGLIYTFQGESASALACYEKSLKLFEEINFKIGVSQSLNDIGLTYYNANELTKSLTYYERSLSIQEEMKDKDGISTSYNNIGSVYERLGQYPKALEYYKSSLNIREETDRKFLIVQSLNSLGAVCFKMEVGNGGHKKFGEALNYIERSLKLSKDLGYPKSLKNAEFVLAKIDSAMGDYKGALEHFKQFVLFRDSLNNEQTRKASIKSELNYEYEKKEAVIKEQQEKERAVATEKDSFQKIIIAAVALGLILVIVFAFFIARSLRQTREQKLIIEQKQHEILDSIRYAKRIQSALMPPESVIDKSLKKLQGK